MLKIALSKRAHSFKQRLNYLRISRTFESLPFTLPTNPQKFSGDFGPWVSGRPSSSVKLKLLGSRCFRP